LRLLSLERRRSRRLPAGKNPQKGLKRVGNVVTKKSKQGVSVKGNSESRRKSAVKNFLRENLVTQTDTTESEGSQNELRGT